MMKPLADTALSYIEDNRALLTELSDRIWEAAELALHENRSAQYLQEVLRGEGFEIEVGVADMPTAFVASWGTRRPVLGFLGEYDALAGMSQKATVERDPLVPGGAGHACGHNLLGVGALAAAVGLKHEMQARGIEGTIRYFGCPAEENLSGKAFMARDGVFDGTDVCLTWHPGGLNRVWAGSSLANNAVNITFRGRTAHAAAAPHQGRSALDAVQLMNLGVEFLREHVPDEARVHYAITDGGGQPNVVPDVARVWYLIRAPEREQVDELHERVLDCANGAAIMTGTSYEVELLKAIWNVLPNGPLEEVLEESMGAVGPPRFSPEDEEFARRIAETFDADNRDAAVRAPGLTPRERRDLQEQVLNTTVLSANRRSISGSTDVGDVSWCCPTGQVSTACNAIGTPGHSWQYVAQAGMGIGHQGMLQAGRILAEAGLRLMTDPHLLRRARDDFQDRTGGREYRSAMPPGQKPAFDQFADV